MRHTVTVSCVFSIHTVSLHSPTPTPSPLLFTPPLHPTPSPTLPAVCWLRWQPVLLRTL